MRKRIRSKISSMGELNTYGSSSSVVDMMTFDRERGGQPNHGTCEDGTARRHHLLGSHEVGQDVVRETELGARLQRPVWSRITEEKCRRGSWLSLGVGSGPTRLVGLEQDGGHDGVAARCRAGLPEVC